jgi:cytochrome c-type biogenesis protein CcmH
VRRGGGISGLAALVACASVLLAMPGPASSATPQTNLADIEDEVMCTICGTLLELSEAPQADRQRELIRRLIDEGRTKEEIKDVLVAEYGSEVLATPGDDGIDLAAWIVPGLALLGAGAAIGVYAVRRLRHPPEPTGTPPIEAADASRLDEDMSHYER